MIVRTALALLLAGAAGVAAPAENRDLKADARLAKALAGLTPGKPRSCIHTSPSGATGKYGNTVLLEDRSGTLYRTQLVGGCFARDQDALVTRSFGTGTCSGDIVQITDLQAGFPRESCSFSEFTPYRRP